MHAHSVADLFRVIEKLNSSSESHLFHAVFLASSSGESRRTKVSHKTIVNESTTPDCPFWQAKSTNAQ